MKLILAFGLLVLAATAFANHEELHDHNSPCGQPLFQLPKNAPACLAAIPRFYHDHATGKCLEFSYDGCNKNENHFETKEECDKACGEWHEIHKDHDHTHKHTEGCGGGDHKHNHDEHAHHHH